MKKRYVILNYYLGCAGDPDHVYHSASLWITKIRCAYLNWTQRKIGEVFKQRYEVLDTQEKLFLLLKKTYEETNE